MSRGETRLRDGMNAIATMLAAQVEAKVDYFGKTAEFVKVGPPRYHLGNFNTLDRLRLREIEYRRYVKELAGFNEVSEERTAAMAHADELIHEFRTLYNTIRVELFDFIEDRIPQADKAADEARRKVRPAIERLDSWVRTCFGLTADDFLDCVFNLALVGSPINANSSGEIAGKVSWSGHGAFRRATMTSAGPVTPCFPKGLAMGAPVLWCANQ